MSRIALSHTGDWKLEFEDDQDVRGYRVLDADGNDLGTTVEDMIVDTDQEMVDAVLFSDGTEYPARDLSIGDGVVYATAGTFDGARRAADIDRYGAVAMSTGRAYSDDVIVEYDTDYRGHYDGAYAASGRDFDDVKNAYYFGTVAAHHDDYRNRAYLDAEGDLRGYYGTEHPGRDFDADRDAIRYGYHRARRGR